jgi:hypothetical protein
LLDETEAARKNIDIKLEVENIREDCNESEALQRQLNFLAAQGDQLRGKDEENLIYEAKSSSKEAERIREDMNVLKYRNI